MHTKQVTTSGWYENDNGTITYHYWQNGRICDGATLSGWAELAEILAGEDRERAERYAD